MIENQGEPVEIIKYLENPPSTDEIKDLLAQLNLSAKDILRTGEAEYKTYGFAQADSDERLIDLLHQYPKVMERPIVSYQGKAKIGRPPEQVLELFS